MNKVWGRSKPERP